METCFLFLRQDLKDSAANWILVAFLGAGFLFLRRLGLLHGLGNASEVVFYLGMGLILMSLSHPHCRVVWGGRTPAPLSRDYLKNLPYSRTRLFLLCFLRGAPGDLPFAAFLTWALPHLNFLPEVAARLKGYPILPREAMPSEYGLTLALVCLYLAYSQLSSATYAVLQERLARTNDRALRVRGYGILLAMGAGLPSTVAAGLGWVIFCSFYGVPWNAFAWIVLALGPPLTAAHFLWLRRTWLWE